jgi:hypothetical protein
MLQIRQQQMTAFEMAALRQFENEMVLHSQDFSPQLCEVIGEEQLHIALSQAISRAIGYGFTYRGPIRLFIEMMFLFGSAFDSDPQYPWAAKILKTSDDQMQRAEELHEKILHYQENVSGPDAINMRRALEDLLVLAQKPEIFSSTNFVADMRQEMVRFFPQKVAYVGEAGLRTLIQEGIAEARKYDFPTPRGDALVVVLMFVIGHGCLSDPLYPWIAQTLKDERIKEPAARAQRLQKKSLTWLENVLALPPQEVET